MIIADPLETPPPRATPPLGADLPCFSILGVRIHNVSGDEATLAIERAINDPPDRPASVFFVNAHTLNLAASDPAYRDVLNSADLVLPDGTGVRWAARLQGVRVRQNLPGTDFVPAMLRAAWGRRRSYFLLGADATTIAAAADHAQRDFPAWRLAGFHHGYLADEQATAAAIAEINAVRPDVLLVGMGNPIQEQWIARNRPRLDVSVCLGVGGLFDFWAGAVHRAPLWLRKVGHEWLWRLWEQPGLKARRYLVGNPRFLARVLRERFR